MNLDKVKLEIKNLKGRKLAFIYNGNRNQKEEFTGVIDKVYSSTFLISLSNGGVKSFSYSDFIMKNLKIVQYK